MAKFLIINADDFGASIGVNQGILESHNRGVVTSASLMVTARATDEAVAMSRDYPGLSLGLHWDVWGEDEREFNLHDHNAVRDEFWRQLDLFHHLLGRLPTHIDSHRHAHREGTVAELFQELVASVGVPLRGDGAVRFLGGFYGQWEWKVSNLRYVSIPFLLKMLREEVSEGWTELSCHPGYVSPDYSAVYLAEREEEVRTLTDARIVKCINALNIALVSYTDYGERNCVP